MRSSQLQFLREKQSEKLKQKKNKHLLFTWDETAFQLSLKNQSDPISIEAFNQFGLPCIPLCGVYGQEYTVCHPLVLIEMPSLRQRDSLLDQFPKSLLQTWGLDADFKKKMQFGTETETETEMEIIDDFYVMIHTHPIRAVCPKFLCENTNEMSMMFHTWLFQDFKMLDEGSTTTEKLPMGLFASPVGGVKPIHQDLLESGISFERLEERPVAIHQYCFSPVSTQFQLVDGHQFHFFFSAAEQKPNAEKPKGKRVVAFHVVPTDEHAEKQVRDALEKSDDLLSLVSNFEVAAPEIAESLVNLFLPL